MEADLAPTHPRGHPGVLRTPERETPAEAEGGEVPEAPASYQPAAVDKRLINVDEIYLTSTSLFAKIVSVGLPSTHPTEATSCPFRCKLLRSTSSTKRPLISLKLSDSSGRGAGPPAWPR